MNTDGHGSGMEAAKDAEHAERGKGGWVLRFAWIACVLTVLYVLSVGPVLRMQDSIRDRFQVFRTVYAPLAFLTDHVPACERMFRWYVHDLWGARLYLAQT